MRLAAKSTSWSVERASVCALAWLIMLACLAPPGSTARAQQPQRDSAAAQQPSWKIAKTLTLGSSKVALSEPVLVARSKGYLWFPTLIRLEGGGLVALMSNYADVHTTTSTSLVAFSGDGGLSWTQPQPALYADAHLRLPSGDQLLLPYYLFPRDGGMGSAYQIIAKGTRAIHKVKEGVVVTGWPRPDRSLQPDLKLAGFVFNGQTVELKPKGYLATLYGYFRDTQRDSLVAAGSDDGIHWQIRSTIADERCPLEGDEGPCEAALCRLKDGRILCVFRLASGVAYGRSFSSDEGKTWTKAEVVEGAFSVQPSLAVLPDGRVVLSGGRPGLFAWLNADGEAKRWEPIDILAHHNACRPDEAIDAPGHTSSYTEVVPVGDRELLTIYDRIPRGWNAIPPDAAETNSAWVVKLVIDPVE